MHALTEDMQEEPIAIMEGQDIARFEKPGFYDEDIGCFEAGLLVEGMVRAGSPEGFPDQGVGQAWCSALCMWRCGVANGIAIDSE